MSHHNQSNVSDSDKDAQAGAKFNPFNRRLLIFAGSVALLATGGILVIVVIDPAEKSIAQEGAKVLMQVVGVVLLGGIFSYAIAALQINHQASEFEVNRRHAAEQQLNDFRHQLLEHTIANYNSIKRSRRQLRAAGYGGPGASSGDAGAARKKYRAELEKINDAQLEFERLGKLAHGAGIDGLREKFEQCSKYLKTIYGEYERNRYAPRPCDLETDSNVKLRDFLAKREPGRGFGKFALDTGEVVASLATGTPVEEGNTEEDLTRPAVAPESRPLVSIHRGFFATTIEFRPIFERQRPDATSKDQAAGHKIDGNLFNASTRRLHVEGATHDRDQSVGIQRS